ncbi:MAG: DUF1932 domain-containing protein [Chthoniobacter sp.]|nr:DUF1932 domain-containing protein [Chthoniobacter sp.]
MNAERPVVALVGTGSMGAAIARRLGRHGVRVLSPAGRSAESCRRALEAGITLVEPAALAEADFCFSVVPSDAARAVAETYAPLLRSGADPCVWIDWNAIAPATLRGVAEGVQARGLILLDGGIFGLPPAADDSPGPLFYLCGNGAARALVFENCGLRLRIIDAPLGGVSALKLCYAALTKGGIALGAAALLAARREGCAEALCAALRAGQPRLADDLTRSLPDMLPKAGRWVAEMTELAAMIGADADGAGLYRGAGALFAVLAAADGPAGSLREMVQCLHDSAPSAAP